MKPKLKGKNQSSFGVLPGLLGLAETMDKSIEPPRLLRIDLVGSSYWGLYCTALLPVWEFHFSGTTISL